MALLGECLTADRLRKLLNYDPETGLFTWLHDRGNCIRAGSLAGSKHSTGYVCIRIEGRSFRAHRLVWLYLSGAWPTAEIDHRNGVKHDNRVANLRSVTRSVNQQNRRQALATSSTKTLGVSWHKACAKWHAQIVICGRKNHLGMFDTKETAHAAYVAAKRIHHEGCTI